MTIKKFEELDCWKVARQLTRLIYGYTKRSGFSRDFHLAGQITAALISIMNNISEGFDAGSNREFSRFLSYSRRSCSEVQNCLYIALDQSYIDNREFEESYGKCEKVRKIIAGLIRYLKASRTAGSPIAPASKATGQLVKRANG